MEVTSFPDYFWPLSNIENTFTINVVNRGQLLRASENGIFTIRQFFSADGDFNPFSGGNVAQKHGAPYKHMSEIKHGDNLKIEHLHGK